MYIAFTTTNNKLLSFLYLLIWIFLGNYVLMNLFLAILLDGNYYFYEGFSEEKNDEAIEYYDDLTFFIF